MGVGGVMALKVTGTVTITEITQKISGPPSQISLQEALLNQVPFYQNWKCYFFQDNPLVSFNPKGIIIPLRQTRFLT